jgi:hypothetical protein
VSDQPRAIVINPDPADYGTFLILVSYCEHHDMQVTAWCRNLLEANEVIADGGGDLVVCRSPRHLMPYPVEIADEPGWWVDDAPPGQRRPRRTRRIQ